MKIAILYNTTEYLLRFRAELIQSLQACGCDVVVISPLDKSTPRLKTLSVRYREWNLKGQSLNPFTDLAAIVDLSRILRDERPDIVLNFTIKPVIYGSIVAGWLGVPRVVSMITGMGSIFLPSSFKGRLLLRAVHRLYRLATNFNDKVIFQNNEDLNYFVDKKFVHPDSTLRINGSGVNLNLFTPRQTETVRGSFLLISRMIKQKGIYEFVAAAREVRILFPHAKFTMVGPVDNNPEAISSEEIAGWERQGILEYAGVQTDVRPFLERAEVYVLPTYYLEGIPRSILEALAMAKPVITSDWRGCRETVVPAVNGYLVPPQDTAALVQAMTRYLDDPALSKLHGDASRRLAEDKFDVHDVNRQIISALINHHSSRNGDDEIS